MSPPIIIDLIYSSIFLLDSKAKERKTDADVQREREREGKKEIHRFSRVF
jgi:hypothetical protein